MASIFKTGLFPEQQKVVADFKALTAETGYLLPSHMIRLIYTEIGLDPTKTPLLTEFAANFIDQLPVGGGCDWSHGRHVQAAEIDNGYSSVHFQVRCMENEIRDCEGKGPT